MGVPAGLVHEVGAPPVAGAAPVGALMSDLDDLETVAPAKGAPSTAKPATTGAAVAVPYRGARIVSVAVVHPAPITL